MHALLQPFTELVLESNHTFLLLMPLLSSLVIWLAKKLFVLRKNPFLIFQDSAQLVHTIYVLQFALLTLHSQFWPPTLWPLCVYYGQPRVP